MLISTPPFGDDGYSLQLWDNGKEVKCHRKRRVIGISDDTVLGYDCDGGGIAITSFGRTFMEYRAADGWSPDSLVEMDCDKSNSKDGTATTTYFEVVYTGGDCSNCSMAKLCGVMPYCKDFKGAYRS
jgi:hypothetical protein